LLFLSFSVPIEINSSISKKIVDLRSSYSYFSLLGMMTSSLNDNNQWLIEISYINEKSQTVLSDENTQMVNQIDCPTFNTSNVRRRDSLNPRL
jgi:hypothetical protein